MGVKYIMGIVKVLMPKRINISFLFFSVSLSVLLVCAGLYFKRRHSSWPNLEARKLDGYFLKGNTGWTIADSEHCKMNNAATCDSVAQLGNIRIPYVKVNAVSCSKMFHGDRKEILKARDWQLKHRKTSISAKEYILRTVNCKQFVYERGYIMTIPPHEDNTVRMAFSIIMYKGVEHVERILRLIYRPHHFYCIHVDKKSPANVLAAMTGISNCFLNVFIASKLHDVRWGTFTNLLPDLTCMEDLLYYPGWQYFHNLAGQEFPLKTMAEITTIVKAMNGSNDAEGIKTGLTHRYVYHCAMSKSKVYKLTNLLIKCICIMLLSRLPR